MVEIVELRSRIPPRLREDFHSIIVKKYGTKNMRSAVMTDLIARYVMENLQHLGGELSWDGYPGAPNLEKLPKYGLAIQFIRYCGLVGHDEDVMEGVFADNYPELTPYLKDMIPRAGSKIVDGKVRPMNFVAKAVT